MKLVIKLLSYGIIMSIVSIIISKKNSKNNDSKITKDGEFCWPGLFHADFVAGLNFARFHAGIELLKGLHCGAVLFGYAGQRVALAHGYCLMLLLLLFPGFAGCGFLLCGLVGGCLFGCEAFGFGLSGGFLLGVRVHRPT